MTERSTVQRSTLGCFQLDDFDPVEIEFCLQLHRGDKGGHASLSYAGLPRQHMKHDLVSTEIDLALMQSFEQLAESITKF